MVTKKNEINTKNDKRNSNKEEKDIIVVDLRRVVLVLHKLWRNMRDDVLAVRHTVGSHLEIIIGQ